MVFLEELDRDFIRCRPQVCEAGDLNTLHFGLPGYAQVPLVVVMTSVFPGKPLGRTRRASCQVKSLDRQTLSFARKQSRTQPTSSPRPLWPLRSPRRG